MANKVKAKVFEIGQAKAIYISQKLRNDSIYPFTIDEEQDLVIEIKGKSLLVRTRREDEIIE
jgi:hypothetical protein